MPIKDICETKLYFKDDNGDYQPLSHSSEMDITAETEQERFNRMAVEAIREILPDNMELIMY